MAGELRHQSGDRAAAGAATQAEFDKITAHAFDNQATGDIAYASSAAQLSRLAIGGAEGRVLVESSAGIPEWVKGLIAKARWLREGWEWNFASLGGGTQVVSGSGATALDASGWRISLTTGATHASTAGRIMAVPLNIPNAAAASRIDFTKPSFLYAVLHGDGAAGFPSVTQRLYIEDGGPATLAALASHGYGISALAGAISLATRGSGGSEQLVATSPVQSITGGAYQRHILIEHNPATYVRLYMYGVKVAEQTTAANIPSSAGSATRLKFAILRSGGADVTDTAWRLHDLKMGGTY